MKNIAKIALVAASAVAIVSSAHAANDLIVGFTGAGSTSGMDYVYDLGSPSSVLTANDTWNVGTGLGSSFGVIGYNSSGSHIYSTDQAGQGNTIGSSFNSIETDIQTISPGGPRGTTGNTTTTSTTGWTYETAQPIGSPNLSTFEADFGVNPNNPATAQAYLFNETANGNTELSYFTYNSTSGILTYDPVAVPEPSVYGLIAGVGLLAVALRRQVAKA